MEQRSPEWFAARIGRITASSVGAILGNSPNASREDVMRRMVREYHGAESEFTGNIATEYGVNNEAGALIEFKMETELPVDQVGFITREDWAGCSPDGLVGKEAGLEIKCPFGKRKDAVPVFKTLEEQPHYYDQVQFSMWVTGRNQWWFYQWAPNGTGLEAESQNYLWQANALPRLRQFYAEYLDAIKDPAEYLAPKRVEIDTLQAHRMTAEWDELTTAIDNATARKKDLLDEMQALAGGRDAVLAGRNLTKVERAGSVSYAKAIKELLPDADLEKWRGKATEYWLLK